MTIGMSVYGASTGVQGISELKGEITISSPKTFEIQHRAELTSVTSGFGVSSNFGVDEVYTQVKIRKLR